MPISNRSRVLRYFGIRYGISKPPIRVSKAMTRDVGVDRTLLTSKKIRTPSSRFAAAIRADRAHECPQNRQQRWGDARVTDRNAYIGDQSDQR